MALNVSRLAISWLPEHGSALARFALGWAGWDPDLVEPIARHAPGFTETEIAVLAGPVSTTGFGGVVAEPFTLERPESYYAFAEALESAVADTPTARLPRLQLGVVGGRVSLLPVQTALDLSRLRRRAGKLVAEFAEPRARLGLEEAPAVFAALPGEVPVVDANRFHLPLTGEMALSEAYDLIARLRPAMRSVLDERHVVGDVCLLCQCGPNRGFRVAARFPLSERRSHAMMPIGAIIGPPLLMPA